MLTVGLTGGLCSGKSQVAAVFRERGWPVFDADAIGHELLEPGRPEVAELAAYFGDEIVDRAGGIDRARLGARVFGTSAAAQEGRRRLNALLHPRIREEMRARLATCERAGAPHALSEVALLIENNLQSNFDKVIVVTCPDAVKIARFIAREAGRLDAAAARTQAEARLAAQLPDAVKIAVADVVIDSSGDIRVTHLRAEQIEKELASQ